MTTVIYQDCTTEETSELVLLYNNHMCMNVSQKSLTYIGKFADEIKRIKDNNRFLMDCTCLSESEKKNGIWERVISESVMAINHFAHWKKQPKDMCDYLNNHSSLDEFKCLENYFNRLTPYTDKLKNKELAALFTAKNLFIWMIIFDKFTKLHVSDNKFGQFLKSFVCELQYKKINGEDWETIDSDRHTKDRSLIERKVNYLENLMTEFLSSVNTKVEKMDVESFIAECLNMDIKDIHEDMEFYEKSLDNLEETTIKDGSKLLNPENRLSLLAMMVYSYKEEVDLDDWLIEYAKSNNTYFMDQKKNFLHMRQDFERWQMENMKSA